MQNIVKIEKDEMFVDLKSIIRFTKNSENSVKELVRKNKVDLITLGLSYHSDLSISNGEDLNYSELVFNEDVATYLITLMQNTQRVKEFKFNLVKNFRDARKTIRENICLTNKDQVKKLEKENEQKDEKIKKLSESVYAKTRGHGFETVFRIIADTESDISASDFNKLLFEEGILEEEEYTLKRYISNGISSMISNGSIVVHADTAKEVLKKYNVKKVDDRQLRLDFYEEN